MPRYWVLKDRQVAGPYEPAAVARLEGVDLATLVCRDDRRGDNALDWQYLGAYPELFGFMARPEAPAAPTDKPLPPAGVAFQAASWLGDVLKKCKRILKIEQDNAVYAQSRIDKAAERARDLSIRLGVYEKRVGQVEEGMKDVGRRLSQADARREELMRQAALAAEAQKGLQEAAAGTSARRQLLQELIALQKELNARPKPKKKLSLGSLKKPKAVSLKTPGKPKLNIRPLS